MLQFNQAIWRSTKEPTLGKSLTDAQCASIPVFKLDIWKFIWWGSTQGKRQTSVTNATTLALLLVTCSNTWERTLGKDHSSATSALKLSNRNNTSQNILGFIGLHRCSLQFQITFRWKIFCDEYCSFLKHLSLKTWQTAHEISKSDKHISFAPKHIVFCALEQNINCCLDLVQKGPFSMAFVVEYGLVE